MVMSKQTTLPRDVSIPTILRRRIALAVMELEDLYLSGKKVESKNELIMRVVKVLGFLGYNSSEVVGDLERAYDIRCSFLLHTKLAKKKGSKYLEGLANKVLEYLRATILIILSDAFPSKNDMLKLLDNAIESRDANEELKDRLDGIANIKI